jgi:hypothetical protein
MENERIPFKRVRSIGDNLKVSAQFIRENFIPIMKATLVTVIVPILVGALIIGYSTSQMYSNMAANVSNHVVVPPNPFAMITEMIPGYIIVGIGFMMFFIMSISYIKHYANNVETITRSMLFDDVKKNAVKVFFGGIVLGLIIMIGFILCVLPGIYFGVVLSHLFVIAIIEGKGINDFSYCSGICNHVY